METYFGPVLEALHAQKYFSKELQLSVINFTKEIVADFMTNINTMDNYSEDVKQNVMEKLSNMKYAIGYPQEVFDLSKIEEYYEELDLDGKEGYVESMLKMFSYYYKIENSLVKSWKKKLLNKCSQIYIEYYTDDNILCE